jgi:ParB-like nuclease domain
MRAKNDHQYCPKIETRGGSSIGTPVSNADNWEKQLPWPIEMLPVDSLRPAKRNARTHSKKQIRDIADSIQRYGVVGPIIADEHRHIVAGHARVAAAKLLGLKHLPVVQLSHLSEAEIRAFALADNKLATKAGWDRQILAIENPGASDRSSTDPPRH